MSALKGAVQEPVYLEPVLSGPALADVEMSALADSGRSEGLHLQLVPARFGYSGFENIGAANDIKTVRLEQSTHDEIRMPEALGVVKDGNDRGRYAEQADLVRARHLHR